MDREKATKTIDSVQFPVSLNQRLEKLIFTAFLLDVQLYTDSVKPLPCVVERWRSNSKTAKFPSLSPAGQGNLIYKDVITVTITLEVK